MLRRAVVHEFHPVAHPCSVYVHRLGDAVQEVHPLGVVHAPTRCRLRISDAFTDVLTNKVAVRRTFSSEDTESVSVRATEHATSAGTDLDLDVATATAAYNASGSDTPALNVSRNQQPHSS